MWPQQMGASLSSLGKQVHAAIKRGQSDEVERLLALDPSAVKAPKWRSGRLPLHTAARHSQAACMRALLKAGAAVDARDRKGNTALHAAADAGAVDCVKLLLDARADRSAANRGGATPELLASTKGHADVLALLAQAAPPPGERPGLCTADRRSLWACCSHATARHAACPGRLEAHTAL